jgi:hypothetical protein
VIRSSSARERRTNVVIATLTVLAVPVVVLALAWALALVILGGNESPECEAFAFDRAEQTGRGHAHHNGEQPSRAACRD